MLFCDLDDDFRSAFVDLSINGLNRWQYQSDDEGGKSRALSIVENTLLLIVLSPDFMVDAGSVPDITPPVIELWEIRMYQFRMERCTSNLVFDHPIMYMRGRSILE